LNVADDNVDADVQGYTPFALYVWGRGCQDSPAMNSTIQATAQDLKGIAVFGTMDGDTNNLTVLEYDIDNYPSVLVFKDGSLVDRFSGNLSKKALERRILTSVNSPSRQSDLHSGGVSYTTMNAKMNKALSTHEPKMLPYNHLELNDDTAYKAKNEYRYLVIDSWKRDCNPCRSMDSILPKMAWDLRGYVVFGRLNMDDNAGMILDYKVMRFPTLLVFKNGYLVGIHVGFTPKEQLEEEILGYL